SLSVRFVQCLAGAGVWHKNRAQELIRWDKPLRRDREIVDYYPRMKAVYEQHAKLEIEKSRKRAGKQGDFSRFIEIGFMEIAGFRVFNPALSRDSPVCLVRVLTAYSLCDCDSLSWHSEVSRPRPSSPIEASPIEV
ncbi:MAG: hypothetical protein J2P13_04355, partial [Acidobacteria bacterium]|nr:hypothetical protein [Acidobacteriota bacterium]